MGSQRFEIWRAVEVLEQPYGSAYRLGGRLVLTAAHLVGDVGSTCHLRAKRSFGEQISTVVWKARSADVALIELPQEVSECEGAVFGRLPTKREGIFEFEMYGYPEWAWTIRGGNSADSAGRHVQGLIYWGDSSPDNLLVLDPQRLPTGIPSHSGSHWGGNSGAAIVCDGLIIAVQSQHQRSDQPASLEAALLRTIYADQEWRDLLVQHDIDPDPTDILPTAERTIAPYFSSKGLNSNSEDSGSNDKLHYLYDPASLNTLGPARLFPFIGEDGLLRYLFAKFGQDWSKQGKFSQPWSLLLQRINSGLKYWDQVWNSLKIQLPDLEVLQSEWFNVDLPPNEQFDSSFNRNYRSLVAGVVLGIREATKAATPLEVARRRFYAAIESYGRHKPVICHIHERDGGLSDREFSRQRLAGQNPVVLRQSQSTDQPLLDSLKSETLRLQNGEPIDLIQSANQHTLFVADYPLLQKLSEADLRPGLYVGSPVAFFHYTQTGLEPILIQLEKGVVVTPSASGGEEDQWMKSKLFVQVADATYHQLISHLCYTHLAMEAFAIATPRQMPINHPLYRLLRPHFQFLLAINTHHQKMLLEEGAALDQLMAPTVEASLELIDRAYRKRPFNNYALPQFIESRGVGVEYLRDFPYRDDALLLWQAVHHYATEYLKRYYADDTVVQQDHYLQAWAAELGEPLASRPRSEFPQVPSWLPEFLVPGTGLQITRRPNSSRVPGFPDKVSSLSQLIEISTQIIFTCGPQHAAVNFSQFDYLGYPPNAPLAAYCQPRDCTSVTQLLPPQKQDLQQIELTFALCGLPWGQLGSSDLIQFQHEGDRNVLAQFQKDLAAIEREIMSRNQRRMAESGAEYPYLLPSRIPNSINI